jgi:hypothetical protein
MIQWLQNQLGHVKDALNGDKYVMGDIHHVATAGPRIRAGVSIERDTSRVIIAGDANKDVILQRRPVKGAELTKGNAFMMNQGRGILQNLGILKDVHHLPPHKELVLHI